MTNRGDIPPDVQGNLYQPLTLSGYFRLMWPARWGILAFSFSVAILSFFGTYLFPVKYRATAVIRPEQAAKGAGGALKGIVPVLGISLGGDSRLEELEVIFRSKNLAARVFDKHGLWGVVYPKEYDEKTGMLHPDLVDRLRGEGTPKAPQSWDAYEASRKYLTVVSDSRPGTITVSFDAFTPQDAARIVNFYLDEARNLLQEEAIERATRNKKFLMDQITGMVDPQVRERFFALYSDEVEKEMLARNRSQFGFVLIDRAEPPPRKISPKRLVVSGISFATAWFAACLFVLVRRSG